MKDMLLFATGLSVGLIIGLDAARRAYRDVSERLSASNTLLGEAARRLQEPRP